MSPCHDGGLVGRRSCRNRINKKEVFVLFKLYVGIDVSKDFSTAQGLDNTGKKLFYLRFGMNAEGFSAVLKSMMKYAESINDIRAAMESTGGYLYARRRQIKRMP
jgi:transposase